MITLPNFECQLTHFDNGEFKTNCINLNEFIKANNTGLILYFYPKDNTQGCTLQAVEFSEHLAQFQELGYTIIGVSRDKIKSHENFIKKQDLKIALISDDNEQLCQYFDVIKEKTMYGKKVMGVVRSTFVFDKDGQLLHELRNVQSKTHQSQLLLLLSNHQATP